jgi:uncharacterized protein YndB with AHSA1/START domain
MQTRVVEWDARTGGNWRYVSTRDGQEYGFRGCFHEVRPDRIVQTFTLEGQPDGVALGTLWFEDLGNGRTRLRHDGRRRRGLRHRPGISSYKRSSTLLRHG